MIPENVRDGLTYNPISGLFFRKSRPLGGPKSKYITIRYFDKVYKAHILAWFFYYGVWPKCQLDHEDRNKRNNAIRNLRELDTSTNCHNQFGARASNKTTGFQGVKVHKRKSGSVAYRAVISIKSKDVHLGLFNTPQEAHNAYMKRKLEHLDAETN